MVWDNDTQFRLLDREGFFEVQRAYSEVLKKYGDFVCPITGGDVRDIDGTNCCTNRVLYISGEGDKWAQHFDLNHYRKERDETYECKFFTVAPTAEGLQKGKKRLEEALSMTDEKRAERIARREVRAAVSS